MNDTNNNYTGRTPDHDLPVFAPFRPIDFNQALCKKPKNAWELLPGEEFHGGDADMFPNCDGPAGPGIRVPAFVRIGLEGPDGKVERFWVHPFDGLGAPEELVLLGHVCNVLVFSNDHGVSAGDNLFFGQQHILDTLAREPGNEGIGITPWTYTWAEYMAETITAEEADRPARLLALDHQDYDLCWYESIFVNADEVLQEELGAMPPGEPENIDVRPREVILAGQPHLDAYLGELEGELEIDQLLALLDRTFRAVVRKGDQARKITREELDIAARFAHDVVFVRPKICLRRHEHQERLEWSWKQLQSNPAVTRPKLVFKYYYALSEAIWHAAEPQ